MDGNDERHEDRPRYVDRRRARHIQDDRSRSDHEGAPTGGDASGEPGGWSRTLDRIVRAIRGGRPAGVVLALIALVMGACGGGTTSDAAGPSPSPTSVESETEMLSGTTTCEDPAGDVYAIDPSQLPTDGDDPNVRAADIPSVSVEATRSGIAVVLERDEPGDPPTGEVQHTLWMRGEDGSTGVVRATWVAEPGSTDWTIEAGSSLDSLEPIDVAGADARPGRTFIPVTREAIPVEPPFSWAVEHAMLASGVADICPNVDPQSPLAQADELPVFPEDDTVGSTGGQAVGIVARNYAFEGVPEQAALDTRLTFRNAADEPHEMVLLRLNDDAPPVEEFVQMPREEGQPYANLVGVSIAMPGQPGVIRQGDLLLDQPGTYVLLCGFPTGVTPEFIKENFAGPPEGPPPEDFGPPHVAHGMFASIEVGG